jgi:proteasome lid subunit RPN8/RPN11
MSQVARYVPMPALIPSLLDHASASLRRRRPAILWSPLGLDDACDTSIARRVVIPLDLLIVAWRAVFPPERMMILIGRSDNETVRITSIRDVTWERRSVAYVKASSVLLSQALLDSEVSGARLVGWLHSHPGSGIGASIPSSIDLAQDADWRRDFGDGFVGLITTADGWVRGFGRAVDDSIVALSFEGFGIQQIHGDRHVYRLGIR